MKNKQKLLDLLSEEQEHVLTALLGADPLSERYQTGLGNFRDLYWLLRDIECGAGALPVGIAPANTPELTDAKDSAAEEQIVEEPAQPETAPEAEEATESPKYTKAQVRKLLGEAQAKYPELNLPEVLHSFGAKVLSDISADKYPDLLAKVDAAVQELE